MYGLPLLLLYRINFMAHTYSVAEVERLMKNYLDFRYHLEGSAQRLPENASYIQPRWTGELPLGMKRTDPRPWPFREPRHATPPRDGKAKAKKMEMVWGSMLDLERGLAQLSDDDLALMYKYYIFQTHTLEELKTELHTDHPSTVQRRLQRIVKKLTRIMENDVNDYGPN